MNDIAATLRALADELDHRAPAAPAVNLDDPYADVQGPPAGVDPMVWARENPDAARLYALKVTHAMIGGHRAQRDPAREQRLADRDEAEANRWVFGNRLLSEVGIPDVVYWRSMADAYWKATGRDIRLDGVLAGAKKDLDAAYLLGASEQLVRQYPPAAYAGPLRAEIAAMLGGV
jgi:hypothetical protein